MLDKDKDIGAIVLTGDKKAFAAGAGILLSSTPIYLILFFCFIILFF